jgi:hypothetical protein
MTSKLSSLADAYSVLDLEEVGLLLVFVSF